MSCTLADLCSYSRLRCTLTLQFQLLTLDLVETSDPNFGFASLAHDAQDYFFVQLWVSDAGCTLSALDASPDKMSIATAYLSESQTSHSAIQIQALALGSDLSCFQNWLHRGLKH